MVGCVVGGGAGGGGPLFFNFFYKNPPPPPPPHTHTHIHTYKLSLLHINTGPDQLFHPSTLGIALVEGYDSMGFELSKPHLRAQTEAACKDICEGRTDKDSVVCVCVCLRALIL